MTWRGRIKLGVEFVVNSYSIESELNSPLERH